MIKLCEECAHEAMVIVSILDVVARFAVHVWLHSLHAIFNFVSGQILRQNQ